MMDGQHSYLIKTPLPRNTHNLDTRARTLLNYTAPSHATSGQFSLIPHCQYCRSAALRVMFPVKD